MVGRPTAPTKLLAVADASKMRFCGICIWGRATIMRLHWAIMPPPLVLGNLERNGKLALAPAGGVKVVFTCERLRRAGC